MAEGTITGHGVEHAIAGGGRRPAHHFDDLAQQSEAVTLGMWVFLVTEVMFFGGLFTGYSVYRSSFPEAYALASHHLDVTLGAINTAVLIASSLTMALAVHAAMKAKKGQIVGFVVATMALGAVFLGIKAVEYSHKFHEHLVPGATFTREIPDWHHQQLFFSFYFGMTGMHALHMVIGMGIMIVLLVHVLRSPDPGAHDRKIEVMGLYWHFVDVIWIFLFPLLYLIGRHG
jgi:cytochrome c oxidase subunit III